MAGLLCAIGFAFVMVALAQSAQNDRIAEAFRVVILQAIERGYVCAEDRLSLMECKQRQVHRWWMQEQAIYHAPKIEVR